MSQWRESNLFCFPTFAGHSKCVVVECAKQTTEVFFANFDQVNVTTYKCKPEFKSLVFSQLFQGHGECFIVDSAVYRKGECFCSEGWQVNSKHVVTHNYEW